MVYAILRGDIMAARRLLNVGVDPNIRDRGVAILTYAMAKDRTDIVNLLLERGASLSAPGNESFLSAAAYAGNAEMLSLGVERGLDINRRPKHDLSPFEELIRTNNTTLMDYLVELGVRPENVRFWRWFAVPSVTIRKAAELGVPIPPEYLKAVNAGEWDLPGEAASVEAETQVRLRGESRET